MAKTKKHPKRVKISALRLRDFVRDIQETMADCYLEGSSEYMLDGIEIAFKKHGIPELKASDRTNERAYSGPKITVTVEDPVTGRFIVVPE